MKYLIWALLCFVLGCSQSLNQHAFPQSVKTNSLIYSPMLAEPEVVEQLQTLLKDNGWALQNVQVLMASNQWFTKDNLGLFLIPQNAHIDDGRSVADLVNHYQSVQCPQQFELQLRQDGRFSIKGKVASALDSEGKWQLSSYPYLHLYRDEPYLNFYYQVEQHQIQDAVGKIHLISLTPLTTSLSIPNCSFELERRIAVPG